MAGKRCGRRIGGALFILLLFASSAPATHEADHRFIVFGAVRDDRGNPIADAKVIVVDPRLDEGMTVFTGRNGEYEALLHLHNTDLGDEIIVTTSDQRKTIRAEFDPNDKETTRKARVDFGSPPSPSSGVGRFGTWAIVGTAVILGAFVAFALSRFYGKRKRRTSPKARKKGW